MSESVPPWADAGFSPVVPLAPPQRTKSYTMSVGGWDITVVCGRSWVDLCISGVDMDDNWNECGWSGSLSRCYPDPESAFEAGAWLAAVAREREGSAE